MDTFRNRLTAALIVLLTLSAMAFALTLARTEELRSAVRAQAADQAQIEGYLELHSYVGDLYSQYDRILDSADAATAVDFAAYRRQVEDLLLSLRAEIERETIEQNEAESPDQAVGSPASEGDRLLSLAGEIQSMLAGMEIGAALLRAGRTEEGRKVLEEALDESVDQKLDAIVFEAVAADRAEALASKEAILTRLDAVAYRSSAAFAAFALLLVATGAAILVPFVRSMAFLQAQTDKLALGGSVDPSPNRECREFAAVHDGLRRAAETQAQLRDERDVREDEFARRTDAMRRDDQVRRDFLADASHELRTPLTVLRGVAEVALRTQSNDPEELRTTLTRIVDEARHVTRIVDDLFFIARSRAGTLDLRTDIVDLTALSAVAAKKAEALAERARGRVTWHGPPATVEVEGDADRLRQLYTILVDNALKYGGRRSTVEVSHVLHGETVVIDIRDHGPGVPEEDLPHVFERLYRGAAPKDSDGSGLGLPLAKSIVEGHGGSISLENAKGGGALARVSLPIFDADALEVNEA